MTSNDVIEANLKQPLTRYALPYLNDIVAGDSTTLLRDLPSDCIDLIASDIPYGIGADHWDVLHNNTNSAYLGASPAQAKAGKVFKRRGKLECPRFRVHGNGGGPGYAP